jgi:acyl carrier protein
MQTLDIEAGVRGFITDNFLFGQPMELPSDESLLALGLIDSTGVLELIMFLEEQYLINVEDQELLPSNLDSINNITQFVMKKLARA